MRSKESAEEEAMEIMVIRHGLTASDDIAGNEAVVNIRGLDNRQQPITLQLSKDDLEALLELRAEAQVELDKVLE